MAKKGGPHDLLRRLYAAAASRHGDLMWPRRIVAPPRRKAL
jgi:hypothetical protein